MKLNHTGTVVNFEGAPLQEASVDGMRDTTYRDLVILSLNTMEDGERLGAEAKTRCYHLSSKFYEAKEVKLTVDEAAFIKERAGRILTPLAYGRLVEWIEGEADEADEADEEPAGKPKVVHKGRTTAKA